MKMTSRKMAETIKDRLSHKTWSTRFDREKDQLRVEDDETKKGLTISLPGIIAKWEEKKIRLLMSLCTILKKHLPL